MSGTSNNILGYLSYLETIQSSGSFAAAARKLGITQPALSQAVARIEDEIKFLIFNRSFKGVITTPEGEKLLKELGQCQSQINDVCASILRESKREQNILRIVTKPLLLTTIAPKIASILTNIAPDYQLQLSVNFYNTEIDKLVSNSAADLALIPLIHSDRTGFKHFIDHKLATESFHFWCRRSGLQNTKTIYVLDRGLIAEKTSMETLIKTLQKEQFHIETLPDYGSMSSMVELGQGLGLLPDSFARLGSLIPYHHPFLTHLSSQLGFHIGLRCLDGKSDESKKKVKLIKKICSAFRDHSAHGHL